MRFLRKTLYLSQLDATDANKVKVSPYILNENGLFQCAAPVLPGSAAMLPNQAILMHHSRKSLTKENDG